MTEVPGSLAMRGELTLATVPGWLDRFKAANKRGELPASVDLSGVDRADTSALALLLEVESWARAAGSSICWVSPPSSLRVLADLTRASELLNWTKKDAAS